MFPVVVLQQYTRTFFSKNMDQSVIEGTTLWSSLIQPAIGFHFPRFALFIVVAIPFELFCDMRSRCVACSFTTIFLQLLVGISAAVASYYFYTTYYAYGERMRPPFWYFPLTASVLLLSVASFSIGVWSQLRDRQIVTVAFRCLIFSLTVFFAITLIMTPLEVNRALEKSEITRSTGTG